MNLNSQYSFYPPQPDNPGDFDRYALSRFALAQKGRPEDFGPILKLMSPPAPITSLASAGEFKGLKVGVMGGGLAGLAAAFELRKMGFDITVFEALEDRVGGRVYTYYFDKYKTLYNEFGAARIPVTHETVWHYLNLFRLPTRPFIQFNPHAYVYLRDTRVRNDAAGSNVMRYIYPKYNLSPWERNTSWQKLLYLGMDSHLLHASAGERGEILQVKPVYNKKVLLWDYKSSMNMMESAGLSQDAIALASSFFPLLYGNLYNSYIDFIQESYPVNLAYLYEIPGGLSRLPMAFHKSLTASSPSYEYPGIDDGHLGRVNWQSGCWVSGIRLAGEGQKVTLSYRSHQKENTLEETFDYVVCAIPFSTLRVLAIDPLFSNIKMRAIREVNYTQSQKSMLLCNERFWEKDGIYGGISTTDLPLASIFYPSGSPACINKPGAALQPHKYLPWNEPGTLVGSYNFTLDSIRLTSQPEEDLLREIKREMELVHGLSPGQLDRIVEDFKVLDWDRQPTIRGALSFFAPEQKRIFSYGMAQPEYNERIFFAGEHISAVHRWMQGSLQSGMEAANSLAAACKKHRQTMA